MRRVSIDDLKAMKELGQKIAMLTAYDYPTARLLDEAGVPIILVGDSLGMVVLGYSSTLPVTMADMIHHVGAVVRGTQRTHVVADMPFMRYQDSPEDALRTSHRLLPEPPDSSALSKIEAIPILYQGRCPRRAELRRAWR